jgi:sporulation protein YlmC with PRC-barrel domain
VTDEARVVDGVRDLLDLLISDRDDRPAGRVDDLEFDQEVGDGPVLTALLSGAPALAGQFGGRLAAWMRGLYRRFHDEKEAEPTRVPFQMVQNIDGRVDLNVTTQELGMGRADHWIVDNLLGRIPGADFAPQ